MERWEYQVIHLNVEGPAAPPAAPPPPAPAAEPPPAAAADPARPQPVFSKEYLEKEFPGFYAPVPAQEHPAHQLRGFLNQQGQEGWELVGFYPIGQLLMMIFRRPLPEAQAGLAAGEAAAAGQVAGAAGPALPAGSAPAAAAAATIPTAAEAPVGAQALGRILERLEALERRLGAGAEPGEPVPAERVPERDADPGEPAQTALAVLAGLDEGGILPERQRRELAGRPQVSTAEAARALGFRSAASLFNRAARSGYRPGLIKRGANGRVAVYMGSQNSGRGGRDRRLWVVLAAPAT